jgi:hypothetical protein
LSRLSARLTSAILISTVGLVLVLSIVPIQAHAATDVSSHHVAFSPAPVPYSVTFNQTGIPLQYLFLDWGVIVGSHHYFGSGASITVSGITGNVSYSYDSPAAISLATYATSSCSGTVSGPITITCTYKFHIVQEVPEFPYGSMMLIAVSFAGVLFLRRRLKPGF